VPGLSRRAAGLAVLVAAALGLALLSSRETPSWRAAVSAAVEVRASGCGLGEQRGSGAIVADGRVATVAHLVAGAAEIVVRDASGRRRPARLLALDLERDLALLQVEGLAGKPLVRDEPAAGREGRLLRFTASSFDPIPFRLVRRVRARIPALCGSGTAARDAVEIAAAVDPGDSGAALVDNAGALVGIVFASSRRVEGRAYAVAASELRPLLSSTRSPPPLPGRCP
jgi:S1-C subfamily serine protease